MNFDEEWARLVADTRTDKSTRTQINSAEGNKSSDKKKLNVTPGVLRERAGKSENKVSKEFREAQANTAKKTGEVPGTMKGFAFDEALKVYLECWRKKVAYVKDELGAEGLAGALRSAADSFGTEEKEREESFKPAKPYKPGDII